MDTAPTRAALVIGVDQYRSLSPDGAADLKGARHDAVAWASTARALGIEQIRVLASPPLTAADLPFDATGVTFGEATASQITNGVAWLAEAIGGQDAGQGMLAYSGHGSSDGSTLVLCPSDVRPDLSNAVPYSQIANLLSARAPRTNVTIFLDTCHAAPPHNVTGLLGAIGRRAQVAHGVSVAGLRRELRAGDLVFAACRPAETSQEAFLQNGYHGAFTWAATAALSRASRSEDPDSGLSYFNVSYQDLLEQVAGLLRTLGFAQTPVLEGPPALLALPLLHPKTLPQPQPEVGPFTGGREVLPEETEGGQPMGYAAYEITPFYGGAPIGHLIATGQQSVTIQNQSWPAQREYWFWQGAPWPQGGFRLALVASASLPPLQPNNATQFESKPFPPLSGAKNYYISQNNDWFSISFSTDSAAIPIAWLKVKPTENKWYEYSDVAWETAGGQPTVMPQPWLIVVQEGETLPGGIPYGNHYLQFRYAPGGPNASTDNHPGDGGGNPNPGQYEVTNIVMMTTDKLN